MPGPGENNPAMAYQPHGKQHGDASTVPLWDGFPKGLRVAVVSPDAGLLADARDKLVQLDYDGAGDTSEILPRGPRHRPALTVPHAHR